jgi:hypothetical protein
VRPTTSPPSVADYLDNVVSLTAHNVQTSTACYGEFNFFTSHEYRISAKCPSYRRQLLDDKQLGNADVSVPAVFPEVHCTVTRTEFVSNASIARTVHLI